MYIKLSNYIANFLVDHGIVYNFTITGGGAMHLNDALGHKEGMNCIYHHHEQACAMAAEGYTRLTGKLPCVCVTTGPGGTNAITGVLGAWLDSIPMFVISGQVKRETTTWATDVPLRQLGDQEYNIVASVKPMTKYAHMLTEPNEIRYHLEKMLYFAQNGRGGPVWLDIPLDVQAAIIDTDQLTGFNLADLQEFGNLISDTDLAKKIIDKIKAAKRPVIFVGHGVRLADAADDLLKVLDVLQIPAVTAFNAHDLLWADHPYYCGRPGTIGTRGGNFIVENSDLLLILGCRMNIRQISYNYKNFAKNAYKIMVDIDEAEMRKPTLTIDMPIHANVKEVLTQIEKYDYTPTEDQKRWLAWSKQINAKYPVALPHYYKQKMPMNPYAFMELFSNELGPDDVIVCGNGSACIIPFQTLKIKRGQRLFSNSGCAAMGHGFPAAIGCAVANGDKRTICIDGDGSFQMNLQELQTVVYNHLNLKIIYINNNGYHSIRQTQTNLFKPPLVGVCAGNGVSFPNMEKIAGAYGIPFVRIDHIDDVSSKSRKVLETPGPIFCEVIVDSKQNFEPKLSSKVLPNGKIISPPIDDMYPFLDREEYKKNKDIESI